VLCVQDATRGICPSTVFTKWTLRLYHVIPGYAHQLWDILGYPCL